MTRYLEEVRRNVSKVSTGRSKKKFKERTCQNKLVDKSAKLIGVQIYKTESLSFV